MQGAVAIAVALLLWLLPLQCLLLPFNMAAVDVVGLAVLPLCWIWLVHRRLRVVLPYFAAILLILASTTVACLTSLDPTGSLPVVLKEVYLYAWFVTISCVFVHVDARRRRWLLLAWCWACGLHGALILAQFVWPPLLDLMNARLAGIGGLDPFRPSGLHENSNAAALYQLTGFVPLLALRLPPRRTVALGALFLVMMLGTGSMGAALAFSLGIATLLAGLVLLQHDWTTFGRWIGAGVLGIGVLGGALTILAQGLPSVQQRVRYVLTGRSEYSAESRFAIWTRGSAVLLADLPPTGIGPDMFKKVDGHELHNDLLSFAVERGPAAVLGLLLLAGLAFGRSVRVAREVGPGQGVVELVFPATLVALGTIAQTHEIFHQRPVWLVLALLEPSWQGRHAGARLAGPGAAGAGVARPAPARLPASAS